MYSYKQQNASQPSDRVKTLFSTIKQKSKFIIIGFAFLIIFFNSYDIVGPSERGVKVTLGEVDDVVYQPGIVWHVPFVTEVRRFILQPKTYEVTFEVGDNGAITKDMQTVGATVAVRYTYDENRILDIVKRYANDGIIESAMRDNIKASLKETTGKYSIYSLVDDQRNITEEVSKAILTRMSEFPIAIAQTTITNWDWSDDFDKQIKATANRTQQVKQAEQEANIAAAQAQKMVKEAEARKQAAELDAQAEVAKATGEADAKKIKADAEMYSAQQLAKAKDMKTTEWRHEEEMLRLSQWDGRYVPDYVPLTAAGGIVNLPTK